MSTLPPAGWYDDPEHPGYLRYWDGSEWSEHRSPTGAAGSGANAGGRLSDIGSWLSQTFNDIWGRKVPLLAIGALMLVLWAIAGAVVVWAVDDLVYVEGDWSGFSGSRVALAGVGLLAAGLVSLVLYVAVVHQLYWARFGENHPVGVSFAVAAAATPRVIGWGLVLALGGLAGVAVIAVLGLIAPPLLVLAFLALIPLGIWLWVKLAFFLVAIVAPTAAAENPLRASASVSANGRFWGVFGRLLLLALIGAAIAFAIGLPFTAASSPGNFDDIIVTDGNDEVIFFHVGDFLAEVGLSGGLVALFSSIPQMISSLVGISGTTALYAQVVGRPDARRST